MSSWRKVSSTPRRAASRSAFRSALDEKSAATIRSGFFCWASQHDIDPSPQPISSTRACWRSCGSCSMTRRYQGLVGSPPSGTKSCQASYADRDCSVLAAPPEMLRDLSVQVLGYCGCSEDTVRATADAVTGAVAAAAEAGCQALALTFQSDAAALVIVLSSGEREVWRASHIVS